MKFIPRIRKDILSIFDDQEIDNVYIQLTNGVIVQLEKNGNDNIIIGNKILYRNRKKYRETKKNFNNLDISSINVEKNGRKIKFDLISNTYFITGLRTHVNNNYNIDIPIKFEGGKTMKNYVNVAVQKYNSKIFSKNKAVFNIVEYLNSLDKDPKILCLGVGDAEFELNVLRKFYETNNRPLTVIFIGIDSEHYYDKIYQEISSISKNITSYYFNNTYSEVGKKIMNENSDINELLSNIDVVISVQFQAALIFPANMSKENILKLSKKRITEREYLWKKINSSKPKLFFYGYHINGKLKKQYISLETLD